MPILNDFSISNSQYVDGKEPYRLAGRRVTHELTFVSAGEEKARGDFIAARQQVFDSAMEVRYSGSKSLRSVKQAFGTLRSTFGQRVVTKIVVHRGRGVLHVSRIPERIKQTCRLNHLRNICFRERPINGDRLRLG